MLTDAFLQLSDAQAVTATAVSTNTIDLGANTRDMGPGTELFANFTVGTTFTAVGSATMTLQIISSAAANLGSPTVLLQSDALGKAELTAGRVISLPIGNALLAAQSKGQRYLGVNYVVATGPMTAGAISCSIGDAAHHEPKYYTSGFTVV